MFKENPAFETELLASAQVAEVLKTKGEKVLEDAVAGAANVAHTGEFEHQMTGKFARSASGKPYYRVENHDEAAQSIEFGTFAMEGKHVLRDAIRKAS